MKATASHLPTSLNLPNFSAPAHPPLPVAPTLRLSGRCRCRASSAEPYPQPAPDPTNSSASDSSFGPSRRAAAPAAGSNAAEGLQGPPESEVSRASASLGPQAPSQPPPAGVLQRLKAMLLGNKKFDRQRLAELGFGAFAAYGVVSNINACVLITIAWLTVVKTQGATPLAAGMWPKFLAVYAGLWTCAHFMRPLRLSLALAAAPAFDVALTSIMQRTRLNKVAAFGIMLLSIAVATSTTLGAVLLVLGGFPG